MRLRVKGKLFWRKEEKLFKKLVCTLFSIPCFSRYFCHRGSTLLRLFFKFLDMYKIIIFILEYNCDKSKVFKSYVAHVLSKKSCGYLEMKRIVFNA